MSKINKEQDQNQFGADCRFYRNVSIKGSTLGDGVSVGDDSIIRFSELDDKVEIGRRNTIDRVQIGKSTYTGEFCIIKHCAIGKFCAISWNVSIGGANHDIHHLSVTPLSRIFHDEPLRYRSFAEEDVIIGNDVWIAAGAHILRGVRIGDGAVIAANAVVTQDVEPYSVVGGVPAKTIGQRFASDLIERVSRLKWWDWSEDQLRSARGCFTRPLDDEVLCRLEEIGKLK